MLYFKYIVNLTLFHGITTLQNRLCLTTGSTNTKLSAILQNVPLCEIDSVGVLLLLDYNRNYSHPPGPHATQGPGTAYQPRTGIGQSRSTGPHTTQGPYTHPGQTTGQARSTGPQHTQGPYTSTGHTGLHF